jgi:TRAP-type C4-dicarboxylate transport system substrate-binding protein
MHSARPMVMPRFAAALLAVAAAALATPPPALPAEAVEPVLKLKAAHVADESFAWHKGLERFRDVLRAKTNGSVDVQIYANGVLGSEKDYVQYLVQGVLDVATVQPGSAANLAKEIGFLELMYLWKDHDHWQRALDGDVGQKMTEVLERATAKGTNPGFRVLGYWGGSDMHIASRKQGYQVAKDLTGVKIRAQESQVHQEMWSLQGAQPVVLSFQAAMTALQSGVVECLDSTLFTLLNMKLYEAAPHISMTGHITSVRPLFMSGHTWKKLSALQQKAVLEAAREATVVARTLELQQAQDAEAQLRAKPNVRFYPFKEKQQMRDQTQGLRQRVANDVGLVALLEAVDAGWVEPAGKTPRKK